MQDTLHLDYETFSVVDLKKHGLDRYSADPSTEVLMCSWALNDGDVKLWLAEDGAMPAELAEAIEDPEVIRWAFNMPFERLISNRVLGLKMPIKNTRCTMALAYMQSFFGGLDQVGRQMRLPEDKLKLADGKRLIRKFTMPQRVTAKKPLARLTSWTDPEDWELFGKYCIGDTESERSIKKRLLKYIDSDEEWELYEYDQMINDHGLPIDMEFVRNADRMATLRKAELTSELVELTGLANPNSPAQLTTWLKDRGYPFSDLRKDTVKKVLAENAEQGGLGTMALDEDTLEFDHLEGGFLEGEAVQALLLRQQVARTSTKKYPAIMDRVGEGDMLRHGFQFAGASRTNRWAGRGLNPQNLPRPPKELSVSKDAAAAGVAEDYLLATITDIIRSGDYELLKLTVKEPMNALAGTVRSAIRAPEGYELMATDLSSIETVVIAWLTGCERLLNVFRNGLDAYKDFGQDLYGLPYEEITGKLRQDSKPAVLGCGFRLGGGEMRDGKKTGLWAYAESLGVQMTREEAHKNVKKYRQAYPEVPEGWYAMEKAVRNCLRTGRPTRPVIELGGRKIVMPIRFELRKPYLVMVLPSGRPVFYYKPRMEKVKMSYTDSNGEPVYKENFSYMGKQQNGQAWVRIVTHGGKIMENAVQAVARDVLAVGLKRAMRAMFPICGHVHDELINMIKKGSNRFTVARLIELMTGEIDWAPDMPLGAAGWQAVFYRKD